jgi:hypothetical protein
MEDIVEWSFCRALTLCVFIRVNVACSLFLSVCGGGTDQFSSLIKYAKDVMSFKANRVPAVALSLSSVLNLA